jgi:glucokinase
LDVVAVGACTFGIPGADGVKLAPAIPGWAELALGDELRLAFPRAEVRLSTDVKAAAYAEASDGALVGCNPGMYLNLGTGLAVAVVVDGRVLSGRDGAAGEIGYQLRTVADVGLPETERTILEDVVSGMALRRLASASSGRPTSAADLFAIARDDRAAAALVSDFVTELAYHVVNLAIAINPARIVVGGGIAGAWDQLHPRLRQALDVGVPFPPELMLAQFPFDAPLRGALALGLAAAAQPAPDPAIP